jgi:hypothetical protein
VLLEMLLEFGDTDAIDTSRAFVLGHSIIGKP